MTRRSHRPRRGGADEKKVDNYTLPESPIPPRTLGDTIQTLTPIDDSTPVVPVVQQVPKPGYIKEYVKPNAPLSLPKTDSISSVTRSPATTLPIPDLQDVRKDPTVPTAGGMPSKIRIGKKMYTLYVKMGGEFVTIKRAMAMEKAKAKKKK